MFCIVFVLGQRLVFTNTQFKSSLSSSKKQHRDVIKNIWKKFPKIAIKIFIIFAIYIWSIFERKQLENTFIFLVVQVVTNDGNIKLGLNKLVRHLQSNFNRKVLGHDLLELATSILYPPRERDDHPSSGKNITRCHCSR